MTTTADVEAKPVTTLAVPIRDNLSQSESVVLGFRVPHVTVDTPEGSIDGLSSGAGMGSPFIILTWKGRHACIHGAELLIAWLSTFAPDDAAEVCAAMGRGIVRQDVEVMHFPKPEPKS